MNPFKNASKSFRRLNAQLDGKNDSRGNVARSIGIRRSHMNRTESEFAMKLETMRASGEILRWEYEGITLRWAGLRYTPDFVVFGYTSEPSDNGIRLIEVKGAWTGGKFERAIERFRHARTYWPEFAFELHKKTRDGWKRIY